MIAYVDASVLLRVALGQPDALPEWRQIEQGVSSALVMTESLRTLSRLRLPANLADPEVAKRGGCSTFTWDALGYRFPSFSPDGRWLAYHRASPARTKFTCARFPARLWSGPAGKSQFRRDGAAMGAHRPDLAHAPFTAVVRIPPVLP